MGILDEYRNIKQQLKRLESELAELGGNERLKKELSFLDKFKALREEFSFSQTDAINIIIPKSEQAPVLRKAKRAERRVTTYINPNTQERLATRSGNNRVLRAWRSQYGADVVKTWIDKNS